MTIAVNEKTGEVLQLQNGQWLPAQIAENDKGDRLVLDEGQWKSVPKAEAPRPAPREFQPGLRGGIQRLGAMLESPLETGAPSFGPRFAGGLQNIPEGIAQTLAMTAEQLPEAISPIQPGTAAGITETFQKRRQGLREQFPGVSGTAGEITGELTSALAAPQQAARGLLGRMGQGARVGGLFGAGQLTAPTQEAKGQAVLTGAGFGAATPVALAGAGRLIRPRTRPEVTRLMEEGVTPTPGQILGPQFKRAEEGLTSVPFVGDAIRSAQRRAVTEFNTAALNRALAPIGQSLPKGSAGREAVETAGRMISQRYDDIFDKLKTVQADDVFANDINKARQLMETASADQVRAFENILKRDVVDRFTDEKVTGRLFKRMYSKLGMQIRKFGKSQNPDHQTLAEALGEVQGALKQAVSRSSAEASSSLKQADFAFANLVRVEGAAGRIGSKEGVFSPAQLRAAVRSLDPSVRHRTFARGGALMQDLAETGESVLGATVPDSGTPFRSLMATGPAGLLSTAVASPLAPLYTKSGQDLMAYLLTRRPEQAGLLAELLQSQAPRAAAATGLLGARQ